MIKQPSSTIEEKTWADVRLNAHKLYPELAAIIDEINPGRDYKLWEVSYPFASIMFDKCMLRLPDKNGTLRYINDPVLPKPLVDSLYYNNMPLGYASENSVEVFFDTGEKIFSVYFSNYALMGVYEFFGWSTPYTITAGARSLYMLPKISISHLHKKLKLNFGVISQTPKMLYDHWAIFREIINSPESGCSWNTKMVFFDKKWYEQIKGNSIKWSRLQSYILNIGWVHTNYIKSRTVVDFMWQDIIRELNNNNIKINPYIADTLRHILIIGTGQIPGFAPGVGASIAGPIATIQDIYSNIYNLKEVVPTIIQPQLFSKDYSDFLYYSMQTPTLLATIPHGKTTASNIDDIRALYELIQILKNMNISSDICIDDKNFSDLLNNLEYKFYHSDLYSYGAYIRPSKELSTLDQRFMASANKKAKVFADNGPFVRGCVSIRRCQ